MAQWAYEMSNQELISRFAQACGRAGIANSGFVIDLFGPMYIGEVQYLRSVLLSRLEGVKPPFARGATVRPKSKDPVHSADYYGVLIISTPQKIRGIYYAGERKWLLEFVDIITQSEGEYAKFRAEDFVLVPTAIVTNR